MTNSNITTIFTERRNNKRRFREFRSKFRDGKTIDIPDGLYQKCPDCKKVFSNKEVYTSLFTCPSCSHHLRISAIDRIKITCDSNSFRQKGYGYITLDPLGIEGYNEKIKSLRSKTKLDEAFIYGYSTIEGYPCIVGVMDSHFLMGSMGSVVGEKVTKAFEYAYYKRLPIILFTASGGARMQEGLYSLMQMAKTSQAVAKYNEAKLPYISVLTHPTTGGVTASFSMLGDIILAEPKALVGFAGPRVIEQTIKRKLPKDFQTSEFVLEKGFIDKVVNRKDLRQTLATLLRLHGGKVL